jgi:hypothetical protein
MTARPVGDRVGARAGKDHGRGAGPRKLATSEADGSSRPAAKEGADAAGRACLSTTGGTGERGGAPEVTTTDVVKTAEGTTEAGSGAV